MEAFHPEEEEASPSASFVDPTAVLWRRNRLVLALAATPSLLSFYVIIRAIFADAALLHVALSPLLLAGALVVLAWRRNLWPRSRRASILLDGRGVTVDGELVAPRGRIAGAFVVPRAGKRPGVKVRRRGLREPLEIEAPTLLEGRRMLRALGFDASQEVAEFRLPSRVAAHRRRMLLFPAAFGLIVAAVVGRLFPADFGAGLLGFLSVAMVVLAASPTRLSVGADGLLVRWLGRARFIPRASIRSVRGYEEGFGRTRYRGLHVDLERGAVLRVPVSEAYWDSGDAGMVEQRVREAMATTPGHAALDASILSKGARDVRAWVTTLRAIGEGATATHRTAPVGPERLWGIVEDPGAAPVDRAAAAVALGPLLDDGGRARLRVASRATAAPKLRVALAVAASDDEAELEGALDEMTSDARRRL